MSTRSRASSWSRLLSQTLQNPPKTLSSFSRNISTFSRVLSSQTTGLLISPNAHFSDAAPLPNDSSKTLTKPHFLFCRKISTFSHFPSNQTPKSSFPSEKCRFSTSSFEEDFEESDDDPEDLEDILEEVEKERQREREERIRKGLDTKDIDEEDQEDYMGVMPLIEKLEKKNLKEDTLEFAGYDEPTDSDSDEDDEDEEAKEQMEMVLEKKYDRFEELLDSFTKAETLDECFKLMNRIDKFEEKHFKLRSEYRVIGDLMNRLKFAEGKEKFILQQKLNRAVRLVEWREAYDPNNPANYGVIKHDQVDSHVDSHVDSVEDDGSEKQMISGGDDNEYDMEFDDMKEKDAMLLEKLNAIDKKLEEKLAELDHTFGKRGKLLEEEIRDLAEERNALTEKKSRPLYRKGFDVKLIDVNRTCKVTKGGQVVKYTALLACGNYNGVVGYAKAKGPAVPIALQKAHEKCFQNLHYIDRHEEHTIAHAIQTSYKKTKVLLWPAPTATGMRAGKTVQTILHLAGFKNIKSKVVGSRNPHNTVKALFKALNAVETPKDMQEKFGRTVVEKYLLQ